MTLVIATSYAGNATLTAQNIVDCVSQDIRSQLATSGADGNILLDYTNRVQLDVLRKSRWDWMMSPPKYFITENEQTDYWLGASGANIRGTVDTALNLTDIDYIKEDGVFDRSNFHRLLRTQSQPLSNVLSFKSGDSRPATPALFRHDRVSNPNVLSIFPAPVANNSFQPEPPTPILEQTAGGALVARTYYVKVTFIDTLGNESTPSDPAAVQYIAASNLVRVKSPELPLVLTTRGISYSRYNVYASTTLGSEQKQNASPTNIGTDWTEPAGGLIAGIAPPSANSLTPMDGFLIEFRYYRTRPQVATLGTTLLVPNDYKDILCAGVAFHASKFLSRPEDASLFFSLYQEGLIGMIRDKNQFPKGGEFVRPDPTSTVRGTVTGLGLDSGLESSLP